MVPATHAEWMTAAADKSLSQGGLEIRLVSRPRRRRARRPAIPETVTGNETILVV